MCLLERPRALSRLNQPPIVSCFITYYRTQGSTKLSRLRLKGLRISLVCSIFRATTHSSTKSPFSPVSVRSSSGYCLFRIRCHFPGPLFDFDNLRCSIQNLRLTAPSPRGISAVHRIPTSSRSEVETMVGFIIGFIVETSAAKKAGYKDIWKIPFELRQSIIAGKKIPMQNAWSSERS